MGQKNYGNGEPAQSPRRPGRRPKYGFDGAPPRPVPVNWHIDATAHAQLIRHLDATGERPGEVVSRAIEYYITKKFPDGAPQVPGSKA